MTEFDCIECGRHIFRFVGFPGEPDLCAACMMLPGWFRDPTLRDAIDPDVAPPVHELETHDQ